MLYLEDFLELLEPFTLEIKEKLERIRYIDLNIQTEGNKLEDKVDTFFSQCKKQQKSHEWQEENYEVLRKEYLKLVDNADDKIQLTNKLSDLCDKYIKKLDHEIHKFKLELEADNAGITARLERAVAANDFDTQTYDDFNTIFDDHKTANLLPVYTDFHNQLDSLNNLNSPLNFNDTFSYSQQQNLSPTHSASSNQVATITTSRKKRSHANATASLRINSSNSSLIDMFQPHFSLTNTTTTKRNTKRLRLEDYDDMSNQTLTDTNDDDAVELQTQLLDEDEDEQQDENESSASITDTRQEISMHSHNHRQQQQNSMNNMDETTQGEEQKYCLCKDVSYGDMICCDNRNCKTQWFHFICVGLNQAPKGKWFCPICANQQKRRQRKQQQQQQLQQHVDHTASLYQQLLQHQQEHTSSNSSSSSTTTASSNLLQLQQQQQRDLKQSQSKNDDFDMEFY